LIPKNQKIEDTSKLLQYELTPFRTENEYSDNRHPEKIHRQDNLILDSNRRDFSINSLYYFSTNFDKSQLNTRPNITRKKISNISDIQKTLDKTGILYYQNKNLLIVQKHEYIQKLFNK
jgi:hypothetical protein